MIVKGVNACERRGEDYSWARIKGAGYRNEAWSGRRGGLVVVNEEGQDGSAPNSVVNTRPERRLTLSYPGLRPSYRPMVVTNTSVLQAGISTRCSISISRLQDEELQHYTIWRDTARERSFRS